MEVALIKFSLATPIRDVASGPGLFHSACKDASAAPDRSPKAAEMPLGWKFKFPPIQAHALMR